MEQIPKSPGSSGLVCHAPQVGCWNVANQYLCVTRWLSADVLWDVSDGEVNQICLLSTGDGKMGLIGRDDNRHYGCARLT